MFSRCYSLCCALCLGEDPGPVPHGDDNAGAAGEDGAEATAVPLHHQMPR